MDCTFLFLHHWKMSVLLERFDAASNHWQLAAGAMHEDKCELSGEQNYCGAWIHNLTSSSNLSGASRASSVEAPYAKHAMQDRKSGQNLKSATACRYPFHQNS